MCVQALAPGVCIAGCALRRRAPARPSAACAISRRPRSADDSARGDVQLQIETSLNFDRLILRARAGRRGPSGQTAEHGAEGAVADMGPRAMVGTVLVHGKPTAPCGRPAAPDRAVFLGGGRITPRRSHERLPSMPRLDAAGQPQLPLRRPTARIRRRRWPISRRPADHRRISVTDPPLRPQKPNAPLTRGLSEAVSDPG